MGHELDIATYLEQGESALSNEAKFHLQSCARCQRELAAHQRVADQLRAVKPMSAPPEFTLESVLARLPIEQEEALLAPVLKQLGSRSAPVALKPPAWSALRPRPAQRIPSMRRVVMTRWLVAAAAILVVGVTLPSLIRHSPRSGHHPLVRASIVVVDPYQAELSAGMRERILPFGPWLALRGEPQ